MLRRWRPRHSHIRPRRHLMASTTKLHGLRRLWGCSKRQAREMLATINPPPEPYVDPDLLELTYDQTWHRSGSHMIVNGLVQIGRSRDGGASQWHWGSAHVHSYGTSVIGNELRRILKEPSATHEAELTLEYDNEPSLFDDQTRPSRIVFCYTAGPSRGRSFYFAPVDGDEDGWSEMVAYARKLIATDAVQRICRHQTSPAPA